MVDPVVLDCYSLSNELKYSLEICYLISSLGLASILSLKACKQNLVCKKMSKIKAEVDQAKSEC